MLTRTNNMDFHSISFQFKNKIFHQNSHSECSSFVTLTQAIPSQDRYNQLAIGECHPRPILEVATCLVFPTQAELPKWGATIFGNKNRKARLAYKVATQLPASHPSTYHQQQQSSHPNPTSILAVTNVLYTSLPINHRRIQLPWYYFQTSTQSIPPI